MGSNGTVVDIPHSSQIALDVTRPLHVAPVCDLVRGRQCGQRLGGTKSFKAKNACSSSANIKSCLQITQLMVSSISVLITNFAGSRLSSYQGIGTL